MKEYLLAIKALHEAKYLSDEDVSRCVEHITNEISDYPACNSAVEVCSAKEEDFLFNYYLKHLQNKEAYKNLSFTEFVKIYQASYKND